MSRSAEKMSYPELKQKRIDFSFSVRSISHNNRAMTPGRKEHRLNASTGRWKGYMPNELIRLKKWLRDEKRALRIFKDKPAGYQTNNIPKKLHMESRIVKLENKIENFSN